MLTSEHLLDFLGAWQAEQYDVHLARQRSGAGGGDELVGSDRQVGLWQEFLQRVRTEQERDWGFISPALAAPPPR